jgi:hypothetical protein
MCHFGNRVLISCHVSRPRIVNCGKSRLCYGNALRSFGVCGGFLSADWAKITVQGGVGGVQNDVAIRAILQVFLDFAFD